MTLEGLLDRRQSRVIVDVPQLVQVGARALFDAAITSVPGFRGLPSAPVAATLRACTAALIDRGAMEQRAHAGWTTGSSGSSPGADRYGLVDGSPCPPTCRCRRGPRWTGSPRKSVSRPRADRSTRRADAFADSLLGSAQVVDHRRAHCADLHRRRRVRRHRGPGLLPRGLDVQSEEPRRPPARRDPSADRMGSRRPNDRPVNVWSSEELWMESGSPRRATDRSAVASQARGCVSTRPA